MRIESNVKRTLSFVVFQLSILYDFIAPIALKFTIDSFAVNKNISK